MPTKLLLDKPVDEKPVIDQKASLAEMREELVQRGDFLAIYASLLQLQWHEVDLTTLFGQLLRALDIASRQDPARYSEGLFQAMASLAGYVLLRVQYAIVQQIQEDDVTMRNRTPVLKVDDVLPQLLEVQSHVAELSQARASTARQWELARQKRLENDRVEREAKYHSASWEPESLSEEAKTNGYLGKAR